MRIYPILLQYGRTETMAAKVDKCPLIPAKQHACPSIQFRIHKRYCPWMQFLQFRNFAQFIFKLTNAGLNDFSFLCLTASQHSDESVTLHNSRKLLWANDMRALIILTIRDGISNSIYPMFFRNKNVIPHRVCAHFFKVNPML